MSKLLAVFLVLLFAAVCSARVLVFTSVQTAPLTASGTAANDFSGVAYGLVNFAGGRNPARIRFFGFNTIGNSIVSASLTLGGFEVAPLRIANRTNSAGLQYVAADIRVNSTTFDAILTNQLVLNITTAAFPGGAIIGTFHNTPGGALAVLSGANVVNPTVNSSALGLAVANFVSTVSESNLPLDVFQRFAAQNASTFLIIQAVQNVTTPTSTSINGPASVTTTGAQIATVSTVTSTIGSVNFANISANIPQNFRLVQQGQTYFTVDVSAGVSAIRGQFFPLATVSRRQVPTEVNVAVGTGRIPVAGFGTLRRANNNNAPSESNSQAFVSIDATNPGTGTFTTSTTVTFNPIIGRARNTANLRGIELDLSIRTRGANVTFAIDWFRSLQSDFIQGTTFNNLPTFTQGTYRLFNPVVNQFPDVQGRITLRITSTATAAHGVDLDLFALRPYTSNGDSNTNLRLISRQLEALNYIAASS